MTTYFERLSQEFVKEDQIDQEHRFVGPHRAVVVDTDDPLAMGRIKFKCPDIHDYTLLPVEAPWAIPANFIGGKSSGHFEVPCIGDFVWIEFEKSNPYAPIWRGYAPPTRLNYYPIPFVAQRTPPANLVENIVNKKPNTNNKLPDVIDYDVKYLPKDGRPMSQGVQSRYGSLSIDSSVGYYPIEHYIEPAPLGLDPIQQKKYDAQNEIPLVNEPDKKFVANITKYGNMLIMSDVGYWWNNDQKIMPYVSRGATGEFSGDFKLDREYEVNRWLYNQKLINEDRPVSWGKGARDVDWNADFGDTRRIEMLTRYGHKIEMRDVGWAQPGEFDAQHKFARSSKSRLGEFSKKESDRRFLSVSKSWDFRWIKIRTKGGMLFQAYDRGNDPEKDEFVKRPLLEEAGHRTEREDLWWWDRDARWMRLVTRHGFKLVLDDRGTSETDADKAETPRGNGFMVKGRRTPGSGGRETEKGNQRGFNFEFNENDLLNRTMWGSPAGQAMEINDRYQYIMVASTLGPDFQEKFRGVEENEFNRKPIAMGDAELRTHHLKIDLENEYIRLKTRAGNGLGPLNSKGSAAGGGINAGFEARDGNSGGDGSWVELVDSSDRGLWLSEKNKLAALRASLGAPMYQYIDQKNNVVAVFNGQASGITQIYAKGSVNIISDGDINLTSAGNINMCVTGSDSFIYVNKAIKVKSDLQPQAKAATPSKFVPTDRGKTYNGPLEECPKKEVEHTYT